MPECCVPFCKTMGGHKFPKDTQLKNAWIIAIKRQKSKTDKTLWEPTKHSVVCKAHFKPEDLIKESRYHGKYTVCIVKISVVMLALTIASSLH